jgi:uncharacterized protein YcbK (DUF882 family)
MVPSDASISLPTNHTLSRRRLFALGAFAVAFGLSSGSVLAGTRHRRKSGRPASSGRRTTFATKLVKPRVKPERALALYHVHTGERLKIVYWYKGKYLPTAMKNLNRLLRDHHSNAVISIDPQLLDLLYTLGKTLETQTAFHILSAYRSPATNAMLRQSYSGVAEHSLHIEGKAVDIYTPGRDMAIVRRAAIALQCGGVGYYPESNFVHIDTGPVRTWLG